MPIKVLVVDDDRMQQRLVSELLSSRGYEVDTASDGADALSLVRDGEYRLAILDYEMPGMNGVEVYREAKKLLPDLQGVFVTAFTTINVVFPAIDAGVVRVLPKPVDQQELIPLVEELVGKAT